MKTDTRTYPARERMIEGPEAYQRFEKAVRGIIAVPNSVVKERIEEQRRLSALNPNRRGPKRKAK